MHCPQCGFDLTNNSHEANKKFFIIRAGLLPDLRNLLDKCLKSIASCFGGEHDVTENYYTVISVASVSKEVAEVGLSKYYKGQYWLQGKYQPYLRGVIRGVEKSIKQKREYENRNETPNKEMKE